MYALAVSSVFLNIFFVFTLITAPLFAQFPGNSPIPVTSGTSIQPRIDTFVTQLRYEMVSSGFLERDQEGIESRYDLLLRRPLGYYGLLGHSLADPLSAWTTPDSLEDYHGGYVVPLIAELVPSPQK